MGKLERITLWVTLCVLLARNSYPALCDLWDFFHYTGWLHSGGAQ